MTCDGLCWLASALLANFSLSKFIETPHETPSYKPLKPEV
jgi:hypothetical protein